MPTVIPWVNASIAEGSAPAAASAASIAATTPRDSSPGVVGTFAVCSRSPSSSAASVKVPPTSTPSSMRRL